MDNAKLLALAYHLGKMFAWTPEANQSVEAFRGVAENAAAQQYAKKMEKKKEKAEKWGAIGDIAGIGASLIPGLDPVAKIGLDAAIKTGTGLAGGNDLEDVLKNVSTSSLGSALFSKIGGELAKKLAPNKTMVTPSNTMLAASTSKVPTDLLDFMDKTNPLKQIASTTTEPAKQAVQAGVKSTAEASTSPLINQFKEIESTAKSLLDSMNVKSAPTVPQETNPYATTPTVPKTGKWIEFGKQLGAQIPTLINALGRLARSNENNIGNYYGFLRPEVVNMYKQLEQKDKELAMTEAYRNKELGLREQELGLKKEELAQQGKYKEADLALRQKELEQHTLNTTISNLINLKSIIDIDTYHQSQMQLNKEIADREYELNKQKLDLDRQQLGVSSATASLQKQVLERQLQEMDAAKSKINDIQSRAKDIVSKGGKLSTADLQEYINSKQALTPTTPLTAKHAFDSLISLVPNLQIDENGILTSDYLTPDGVKYVNILYSLYKDPERAMDPIDQIIYDSLKNKSSESSGGVLGVDMSPDEFKVEQKLKSLGFDVTPQKTFYKMDLFDEYDEKGQKKIDAMKRFR